MLKRSERTLRAWLVALPIIAALGAGTGGAAPSTASNPSEQSGIDRAIKSYEAKLKAEAVRASDEAIAARLNALVDGAGSIALGNPNGDVTLIEFSDYTCPFCKAVEPRLEQLLKDDRNVKLVIVEFPILSTESLIAAKASLASVRQGKYDSFHRGLMALRGQLTADRIFDVAKEVSLDVDQLRHDMDAPAIADAIIGNFNLARALRITSTPTFVIDGHMVTEASTTLDFARAVAAARSR